MKSIALHTPFEKKAIDLETKVKVTRLSKKKWPWNVKSSNCWQVRVDMNILVYDVIHIVERRKHPNLMTLIKGQGERSTSKCQFPVVYLRKYRSDFFLLLSIRAYIGLSVCLFVCLFVCLWPCLQLFLGKYWTDFDDFENRLWQIRTQGSYSHKFSDISVWHWPCWRSQCYFITLQISW